MTALTNEQIDILHEHLGYSLDLLAMSLREIGQNEHEDRNREWFRQMSIIEVFWSQARILVEFFTGVIGSQRTSAANHFTKTPMKYGFPNAEQLQDKRNDQIAHMNYGRTTDHLKKLRPDEMHLTADAIKRAVKLFEENLQDDAKVIWDERISGRFEIDPSVVYTGNTPSACTAGPQRLVLDASTITSGSKPRLTIHTEQAPPLMGPTGPASPSKM